MIGTTMALLLGGLSAGGALGGAALSSRAAGKAADVQQDATKYAADLQAQSADKALALQKQMYEQGRADLAPWRETGTNALSQLAGLVAPGGGLTAEYGTFDPSQVQFDPGFSFRLDQGQKALERSAAARGTALGGGALKSLAQYSQGLASQEYGNAYGRALQSYGTNRDTFQLNQGNRFNRLAALAGVGQQAIGTGVSAGQNYAGTAGNTMLGTAANIGNLATQGANARASGYVGAANAWGGALGSIGQNAADLYAMTQPWALQYLSGMGGRR